MVGVSSACLSSEEAYDTDVAGGNASPCEEVDYPDSRRCLRSRAEASGMTMTRGMVGGGAPRLLVVADTGGV